MLKLKALYASLSSHSVTERQTFVICDHSTRSRSFISAPADNLALALDFATKARSSGNLKIRRRHDFVLIGMHELEDGNSRQACNSVGMMFKFSEVHVIQLSLDIKRLPSSSFTHW